MCPKNERKKWMIVVYEEREIIKKIKKKNDILMKCGVEYRKSNVDSFEKWVSKIEKSKFLYQNKHKFLHELMRMF